jgi:hypothetical protein
VRGTAEPSLSDTAAIRLLQIAFEVIQCKIAGAMPEDVIDESEVIEVDQSDGCRSSPAG